MIRAASQYFSTVPPVFLDGLFYFLIAVLTAMSGTFSTDEAAKFLPPAGLFWLRSLVTWCLAGVAAVKMFRSTSFAEHQDEKKKNIETQRWVKSNEPAPIP